MVLTRAALNEYDSRIRALGDAAYDLVSRRVSSYISKFPGASVAEVRAFTIESVNFAVSVYGDAAATCAADLYDQMAEAAGVKLPSAALDTSNVTGFIEKEIRYQAGKLVSGRTSEFTDAAARKAKAQTQRRANDTMAKNVKRDGVRYARVPLGFETCTFCLKLASRGFVYKSAKTAGEGTHYHDNCRCKVVPSFDAHGRQTRIEGYDPGELYGQWKKYEEVDALTRYTYAGRQSMKRALAKSPSLTVREVENKWVKRAAGYRSNMDAVNGKDYRDAVLGMFGQELGDTVWKDMRHVLKVRSGQPYESMYVYDLTTGLKIGQVTDSTDELQVLMPGTLRESLRAASSAGHAVAVMHNHPGSSLPSAADISSIARSGAKFGVIACHDGSIVKFAPTDERYQSYNKKDLKAVDEAVKRIINSKRLRGAREAEYISTIEAEVGASIERFVFSK